MHDILLRYYGTQLKDRSTSHSTLYKQLGAYKTWERYEWLWCIWHLKEAGEFEDTVTLLTDYHWISGKLNATGSVYEIAKDYDLIPVSNELKLIQKALLLSAATLEKDPYQLQQQIYGRLGLIENDICRHIAEQALNEINEGKVSLKLLRPTLEIPDLHNLVFKGHTDSVSGAILQGDALISWPDDTTLRSLDIQTGKQLHTFEGHTDSVSGAILQGDALISWSYDTTLRSWDIQTGKPLYTFEGRTGYVFGAILEGDTLISCSYDKTLIWSLDSTIVLKVLDNGANQAKVLGDHLYLIDPHNTFWIYHFPTFEYVARFTTDAYITTLDISPQTNRIILGDRSGRMHFLEAVEFQA